MLVTNRIVLPATPFVPFVNNNQDMKRSYEHPSTEEIALDAPQLLEGTNLENMTENPTEGWG